MKLDTSIYFGRITHLAAYVWFLLPNIAVNLLYLILDHLEMNV